MRGCPEEHSLAVEAQSRVLLLCPVDELVCDIVDGSQVSRGVTATWTITTATRTRTIDQTVQYLAKRGSTKTVSYQMVIQCPE